MISEYVSCCLVIDWIIFLSLGFWHLENLIIRFNGNIRGGITCNETSL